MDGVVDLAEFSRRRRERAAARAVPIDETAHALRWLAEQMDPRALARAMISDIIEALLDGGLSATRGELERLLCPLEGEMSDAFALLCRRDDVRKVLAAMEVSA